MSFDDIISQVKARPELWHSSHPFYRHRAVSARTWKEIASELKTDELTLKKRWKHLKDQYRKERKKVSAKTIPISTWHYYNELFFLTEQPEIEYKCEKSIAGEDGDFDRKSDSDSNEDEVPFKAKRSRKADTESSVSSTKASSVVKTQRGIHSLITKSSDTGKLNVILNRLNAMEETIENRSQSDDTTRTDSDYMFLLSLLPIMKKLTEIQKLQFRGKMNDWLLDIVTQNEYTDRFDCTQSDINNMQPSTE